MTVLAHLSRIRNAGIKIDATEPISLDITGDLMETPLYSLSGGGLGTVRSLLFQRWNAGELPTEPGEYPGIDLLDGTCQVFSLGGYVKARVFVSLEIHQTRHLGVFTDAEWAGLESGAEVPMPDILADWQEIPAEAPTPDHEIEFHAVARY